MLKENQKGFANIALMVFGVLVLVVFIGYIVVSNKPPTSLSPSLVATSTDDTVNWKTYSNTVYGFEFKYPSDWVLCDKQPDFDFLKSAEFIQCVYPLSVDPSLGLIFTLNKDLAFKYPDYDSLKKNYVPAVDHISKEVSLSPDIKALEDCFGDSGSICSLFVFSNKNLIEIEYFEPSHGISYPDVTQKILSTFKFTQ